MKIRTRTVASAAALALIVAGGFVALRFLDAEAPPQALPAHASAVPAPQGPDPFACIGHIAEREIDSAAFKEAAIVLPPTPAPEVISCSLGKCDAAPVDAPAYLHGRVHADGIPAVPRFQLFATPLERPDADPIPLGVLDQGSLTTLRGGQPEGPADLFVRAPASGAYRIELKVDVKLPVVDRVEPIATVAAYDPDARPGFEFDLRRFIRAARLHVVDETGAPVQAGVRLVSKASRIVVDDSGTSEQGILDVGLTHDEVEAVVWSTGYATVRTGVLRGDRVVVLRKAPRVRLQIEGAAIPEGPPFLLVQMMRLRTTGADLDPYQVAEQYEAAVASDGSVEFTVLGPGSFQLTFSLEPTRERFT